MNIILSILMDKSLKWDEHREHKLAEERQTKTSTFRRWGHLAHCQQQGQQICDRIKLTTCYSRWSPLSAKNKIHTIVRWFFHIFGLSWIFISRFHSVWSYSISIWAACDSNSLYCCISIIGRVMGFWFDKIRCCCSIQKYVNDWYLVDDMQMWNFLFPFWMILEWREQIDYYIRSFSLTLTLFL